MNTKSYTYLEFSGEYRDPLTRRPARQRLGLTPANLARAVGGWVAFVDNLDILPERSNSKKFMWVVLFNRLNNLFLLTLRRRRRVTQISRAMTKNDKFLSQNPRLTTFNPVFTMSCRLSFFPRINTDSGLREIEVNINC